MPTDRPLDSTLGKRRAEPIKTYIFDTLEKMPEEGLVFLPIIHYRLECAEEVRRAVREVRPDAIAVEYPRSLKKPIISAVQRLPEISVILYQDGQDRPVYLTIEPADPLVEAVRLSLELDIPLHLVDLDVDYDLRDQEAVPDTYAIQRIGARAYREAYQQAVAGQEPHHLDMRREAGMAYWLEKHLKEAPLLLFVCGMAHLERIQANLATPQTTPLERVRRDLVQVFNLHPESLGLMMSVYPFLSALYEKRRKGPPPAPPEPEMKEVKSGPFSIITGGANPFEREARFDYALQESARRCSEQPGSMADPGPRHPEADPGPRHPVDRQAANWLLIDHAGAHYQKNTGERVERWQRSVLAQFSRNYALLEGRLLPDFFQLVASARAAVDDNFSYEVWDLGAYYPWQRENSTLPTIKMSGDEIWFGTRKLRIRRRLYRRKPRPIRLPRRRKKELRPGEWLAAADGSSLCSYPREDLIVEGYGAYLMKKGKGVLSEERTRSSPFSTSLQDGIDMRETLRNWHMGARIYVREFQKIQGQVGAVVLIFDSDRDNLRYPYCMTWLGEHDQESDMAFYGTSPGLNVVGPGIFRCEYGGLMLSYPPYRLRDVWTDPDYLALRSKPEVLLLAALEYCQEKMVVYVAKKPPRSWFQSAASYLGKKIVYIPIGQLSPVSLKNIRAFHILAGYDKRAFAKDYIY